MSDELDVTGEGDGRSTVIPLTGYPAPRRVLSSEQAQEMAEAKRVRTRARRQVLDEKKQGRIEEAFEAVKEAVEGAVTSDALGKESIEDLADKITYRYAKIVLLGGEAFMPTTLREVTEVAKVWSTIAKGEADRRRQRLPDEAEATPVSDVAAALKAMERKIRDRQRQRALDQSQQA